MYKIVQKVLAVFSPLFGIKIFDTHLLPQRLIIVFTFSSRMTHIFSDSHVCQ